MQTFPLKSINLEEAKKKQFKLVDIITRQMTGSESLTLGDLGVTQGIKDLNVQTDIPVIFCVLTDNTMQQSIDRSGGIHGNKGTEAAIAAIKMAFIRQQASLSHQIDNQHLLSAGAMQLEEGSPLELKE